MKPTEDAFPDPSMPPAGPPTRSSVGQDNPQVIQALREYVSALEAGRQPNRQEFLAQHRDLGDALVECLDGLEFLHRAAPQWQESPPALAIASVEPPAAIQQAAPLGDFRLLREIGRGGMGVVYEAEQLSLGRRVALKILPLAATLDPKQLQRFKHEAQAAAHLHHTNIVPVFAVGCERGVHFYAMQFIEGQTLAEVIEELRRKNEECRGSANECPSTFDLLSSFDPGPSSVARRPTFFQVVAQLGVQAAEALEHAHGLGVVHRDIKPANLLVDGRGHLWITDFGLARFQNDPGLTLSGDLVGTLRYMSPEQALAKRGLVDHRSDIYSLGVTLYEFLTLQVVLDGRDREEVLQQLVWEEPRPPRRWNAALPRELETIVLKAMEKIPESRYATAQELADDLRRFLEDKPIRARRPTLRDRAIKWARRHKSAVAAAVVVLLVAVAALTVSTILIGLEQIRTQQEQNRTKAALYRSLVGEARALRLARSSGYRQEALERLRWALELETPERDVEQLRQEAVACLGDYLGLKAETWTDFASDIQALAVQPQGELLALSLSDGSVALRSLARGVPTAQLRAGGELIRDLAFRPDGKSLVAVDASLTVRIWEWQAPNAWVQVKTLLPLSVLGRPWLGPMAVALAADGQQLAVTFARAGAIHVWDLESGTLIALLHSPEKGKLGELALSPDGRLLAAGYEKNGRQAILVWDVATQAIRSELPAPVEGLYRGTFSPDGSLLVCAAPAGFAIYDTTLFRLRFWRHADEARSHTLSADGQRLAYVGMYGGLVTVWNVAANQERELVGLPFPGTLRLAVFSADGRVLVAAGGRRVRIWNLAGTAEKLTLSGHHAGVTGVAFSPDGKLLASASRDHTVRIWEATTGKVVHTLTGFPGPVFKVAFSPDGRLLATGGYHSARLWDVVTGEVRVDLDRRLGTQENGADRCVVWSVAFSPDGACLAWGGYGCGVSVWRLGSEPAGKGKKPRLSMKRLAQVTKEDAVGLCFSRGTNLLAWVDPARAVHLWDLVRSQKKPFPWVRLAGVIATLDFYPDGQHLVFADETHKAEVWDVTSGAKVFAFGESHAERSGALLRSKTALSADGTWYAMQDTAVTIWDTQSGKQLLALPEEGSKVLSLAWSPNREQLAIGSTDELVIWNLPQIRAQLALMGLAW